MARLQCQVVGLFAFWFFFFLFGADAAFNRSEKGQSRGTHTSAIHKTGPSSSGKDTQLWPRVKLPSLGHGRQLPAEGQNKQHRGSQILSGAVRRQERRPRSRASKHSFVQQLLTEPSGSRQGSREATMWQRPPRAPRDAALRSWQGRAAAAPPAWQQPPHTRNISQRRPNPGTDPKSERTPQPAATPKLAACPATPPNPETSPKPGSTPCSHRHPPNPAAPSMPTDTPKAGAVTTPAHNPQSPERPARRGRNPPIGRLPPPKPDDTPRDRPHARNSPDRPLAAGAAHGPGPAGVP